MAPSSVPELLQRLVSVIIVAGFLVQLKETTLATWFIIFQAAVQNCTHIFCPEWPHYCSI